MKEFIKNNLNKKTLLYRALKKFYNKISQIKYTVSKPASSIDYQTWIIRNEPHIWNSLKKESKRPKVSIIVPCYNTPDKYLKPLLNSVLSQTYDNWELCISDASIDENRARAIEEACKQDSRIKYSLNPGLHISDNTNKAIEMSEGAYIALLDHDDTLSVHALEEVAVSINENNFPDIIYSDEDKISDDGKTRSLPFFKPDWSPDLLLGVNYITHFLVIKKELIDKVGGLRSDFDGAQDYDLLLRVTEIARGIVHIPKILYHWRLADGSTAKDVGQKNYADDAGQRALAQAVERRSIAAEVVEIPERPTNYRLRYHLPDNNPKVSIIIPFKDKPSILKDCVDSILNKTSYDNYEIVLISNNSEEKETKDLVSEYSKHEKIISYEWNEPFNYSKINNFGVSKSKGEYIVLLNNDTEVITKDWLQELLGVATQPGVGVVGPMLLYPDKKNGIQHAGVILGMNTMAGHVFRHRQPGEWTDFGLPDWPRNYLAVTAACLMVSRDIYDQLGGLDEEFIVAGNDVAFCLRSHESGYRNIYWPFVKIVHYESVSVKTYNNGIQKDYDLSLEYYRQYHEDGDPFFNKNLDLLNEQVGIRR